MNKRLAAASGVLLSLLGCGAEDGADKPLEPITIDECEGLPELTLGLSHTQSRVQSAVTLHADGGSGRYHYALEPGGSGGELRDNRLITGSTPATDRVSASDDCGHSASASLEVRGAFEVAPARAQLRPGTRFTLKVSGNLGAVTCEAQTLGSGGSLSEDCAYVAGERPGLDVIRVQDQGSGDQVAVQYAVTADAGLRGAPERLALPRGAALSLHTTGGSDAVTYRLVHGPGKLEGATYVATQDAGDSECIALIEAEDPFTHEHTRLVVQILDELGGSDKPHGRLTDQASLANGDFDGDGSEDLALGVPESDLGKPGGGAVFIFKGSADGLAKQPTWTLTGQSDTASLGAKQLAAKRPASGEAVISALDPSLTHWPLVYRERAPGFGRALAGNVDLDGDGVVDLIVSAPGASINGDGSGAVFAFRGAAAFGGKMDPWLSVLGDPSERANVGQALSVLAGSGDSPASLAIGAPLSYRSGTANGTAWLLQLVAAP